jgi:hypothetical protein
MTAHPARLVEPGSAAGHEIWKANFTQYFSAGARFTRKGPSTAAPSCTLGEVAVTVAGGASAAIGY